ncbi:MAG: cytochrome c3 family protein [Planctomycetota bacterium]|jgi:predicted CXXCH cytochrome family protein
MKADSIETYRVFVIIVLLSRLAAAAVQGSPHDLSAGGGRNPCKFCHTPHGALSNRPLWNHRLSTVIYKIYQSSSLDAKVGQPTGASKMCLSCHDGTVALGNTIKGKGGPAFHIHPGAADLGTDLSDDHPISFVYSDALAAKDIQIRPASTLPEQLRLDRAGELQCTTCHTAHDNQYGHFLVMTDYRSAMCRACHNLFGWAISSHESSMASVSSSSDPYLLDSRYSTVADNACGNCHRPHSAGGHERLLHFAKSEDNCLNCHNGSVARTNLEFDLSRFSRHDVRKHTGVHDLKESASSSPRHVECVDCHNPHSIQNMTSQAPLVSGAMRGASGITISGGIAQRAQYEYEVCFKCHGDNPERITSTITRLITQTNTRLEFNPSNPSFHPVASVGANRNVPSLKPPMTVADRMYCTDCHNRSSASGTKGPHGSDYPPLLAYRYETADDTRESESAYELCYKCHSRNSILNDESFSKHKLHVEEAPCSACHDPHGISSAQGTTENNSHLINFDISIVRSDSSTGRLEFQDQGVFHGQCYLECHGRNHSPLSY